MSNAKRNPPNRGKTKQPEVPPKTLQDTIKETIVLLWRGTVQQITTFDGEDSGGAIAVTSLILSLGVALLVLWAIHAAYTIG